MTSQEKLRCDIGDFIMAMDQGDNLTPEVKANMTVSLYLFVNNAVAKFFDGQKEHGGDIRDKPLAHEINQEHIDLFWYKEAMFHWPKLKTDGPTIGHP